MSRKFGRIFTGHGLVIILACLAMVLFSGCADDKSDGVTKVRMKIPIAQLVEKAAAKAANAIDPNIYPEVAVLIKVSADDLDPSLEFLFSPNEVQSSKGEFELLIPSGPGRQFTPTLFLIAQTTAQDQFPGTYYIPGTSDGNRTVDLTGEPVILDIDMVVAPTSAQSGTLRDDRTGTLSPLLGGGGCANPQVSLKFFISKFNVETRKVPITVDAAGGFTLLAPNLNMKLKGEDLTTGAATPDPVDFPTINPIDLLGAVPLTITPSSVTIFIGDQQTFTVTGGIATYEVIITVNNSGSWLGGAFSPRYAAGEPIIYNAGSTGDTTDEIQAMDNCGVLAYANISVAYPPLAITPENPTIYYTGSQQFIGTGGDGFYNWSIDSGGGTITGTGLYTPSPGLVTTDVIRLEDNSGHIVFTNINVISPPIALSVLTPTLNSDSMTDVMLQIDYILGGSSKPLPNDVNAAAPDTIRLEVIQDANQNGIIDAGEISVKIFEVYDGMPQGILSKIPYDQDAGIPNSISTFIPYYDPPHMTGSYIVRVTNLTTMSSGAGTFVVTPVATRPTHIIGTVRLGATPQPGALVVLQHNWGVNRYTEWAFTNSAGDYDIYSNHITGKAKLIALKKGFVFNLNTAPVVDMSVASSVVDLTIINPGSASLSSQTRDASSQAAIPGIPVIAQSVDDANIAITFSDGSGNLNIPLTNGKSWYILPENIGLLEHGYLNNLKNWVACNVSGAFTAQPLDHWKGDSYIGGTTNPVPPAGMRIAADDPYYLTHTETALDGSGNYQLPAMANSLSNVQIDEFDLGWNMKLSQSIPVNTALTPPWSANPFILTPLISLNGALTKIPGGAGLEGIPIYGIATGYEVAAVTNASGAYSFPTNTGSWHVGPLNSALDIRAYSFVMGADVFVGSSTVNNFNFQSADSTSNSKISGTVKDESTLNPIYNALVDIWESAGSGYITVAGATSGCGGAWSVRMEQAPLHYIAMGSADSYVDEWYQEQTSMFSATQFNVTVPTPLSGINFTLAASSGFITLENSSDSGIEPLSSSICANSDLKQADSINDVSEPQCIFGSDGRFCNDEFFNPIYGSGI